jgi:NAD(P)H-hydrate epimerase
MPGLPHSLYLAAQVRELDRIAIEEHGIPSAELMARAGASAFTALRGRWPRARRIVVVCGGGNNGGDGYVLARLALQAGLEAEVFHVGDTARLRGAAAQAAAAWRADGGVTADWSGQDLAGRDVIVDALLGTGLDRELGGAERAAVEAVNAAAAPVLAIDLPSGLHADSGSVLGAAVRADLTVSFIGLKQGLFTGEGPALCGEIRYAGLDVPAAVFARMRPAARRLSFAALSALLAPRPRTAHKGHHGHVLVVGGEHGMTGAARLAAEAALRSGAGLVSLATRAAHAASISAVRPELMAHGVEDASELTPLLARANVVAVGPGLGRAAWGRALFGHLLDAHRALVVDADALNLLAAEPLWREDWILTPHPGEAARLLGATTAALQRDRFAAVRDLQARYGGVVVLKGAGTLVCDSEGRIGVCDGGNPGMAVGGMGDLLTGIIAGLRAQGLAAAEAAALGVVLHAEAGDRAARAGGERGMIASDLLDALRPLLNPGFNPSPNSGLDSGFEPGSR